MSIPGNTWEIQLRNKLIIQITTLNIFPLPSKNNSWVFLPAVFPTESHLLSRKYI